MEKKLLEKIGAVAVAAALVSCLIAFVSIQAPQCTEASGPVVSKKIELGPFTKINVAGQVEGQIELYLKQDASQSIEVESTENVARAFNASVSDGTLFVIVGFPLGSSSCLGKNAKIKVFVSAASIDSIKAEDSAKVFIESPISQEMLFLEATGSALIDANVSVTDLNSLASNFGTIILAGSAERHSAKAITGGRIIADRLETAYGFLEADENGSIDALVFDEASAIAKTGGSIGIAGGAAITSNVTETGGTVTENTAVTENIDSGGNEADSAIEDGTVTGDEGGEAPEDEEGDGEGSPDEETPPIDGGEGLEPAVCGNGLIEAPEECESYTDCAVDEECSECECVMLPADPGAKIMSPEACTTLGRNMVCGENPACPTGSKNAGNVESDDLPCICCVST